MPRIFTTLTLLTASFIAGAFYLRSSWNEFSALGEENENLRNISAELDELIDNRDALLQTINSVSSQNLKKTDRALPQGPKSSELLVLLELFANKNKVSLKRVDLASAQELKAGSQPRPGGATTLPTGGTVKDFPVTIEVVGSYDAVKNYLRDLEKNLRIIDIQNVSFVTPGKETEFDLTARIKTYFQ